MNEFDFIRQLRDQTSARNTSTRIVSGIGDDAAVFRQSSDRDLVISTDLLVQGIDFHREAAPPRLLGCKALAVSLSDIAAMGARPLWAVVSIGLPTSDWESKFKDEFFAGYLSLADRFGVSLTGGDFSESPQIVIDSIVVGEVHTGRAVLRSTAKAGDQIFVTGSLGGAAAGLKLIELGARIDERSDVRDQRSDQPRGVSPTVRDGADSQQEADGRRHEVSVPGAVATRSGDNSATPRDGSSTVREGADSQQEADGRMQDASVPRQVGTATGPRLISDDDAINALLLRQLSPQARVGWGIILGEEHLATSMIDISDGLSSDLHHLCEESKVGATIDAASLPLDDNVIHLCGRRALDPLALALHGGEDFELLFTVSPENLSHLPKRVDGITISRIGEITDAAAGIIQVREHNHTWPLQPQGFTHFTRAKP